MRRVFLAWLFLIASTFFAGLIGATATMRHRVTLRPLRWLMAAKAFDGLVMGIGVLLLMNVHTRIRPGQAAVYLWVWLFARSMVSITMWWFVLDLTGKTGKPR